jgi:hypothetical protein
MVAPQVRLLSNATVEGTVVEVLGLVDVRFVGGSERIGVLMMAVEGVIPDAEVIDRMGGGCRCHHAELRGGVKSEGWRKCI